MGDGGSREASKAGVCVLGSVGQSLMGGRNSTTMESFESSGLGFTWGRGMKVDVHKIRATSRCLGSTSSKHRDVPKGLFANVVTLRPTS